MNKILAVRGILTGALIYGVYTETGIWTALFAFLVLCSIEMIAFTITTDGESLKAKLDSLRARVRMGR